MLNPLSLLPHDPILGLAEEFSRDPRAQKINLSVGVYYDEAGNIPVFAAVKQAEKKLSELNISKNYLPIDGTSSYHEHIKKLLLRNMDAQKDECISCCYTTGGTGAIRLGSELLYRMNANATVWVSDPTWPVHNNLCKHLGFKVKTYPYLQANGTFALQNILEVLAQAQSDDIIILHACCHNPTGVDPSESEWRTLLTFLQERKIIPFFDMAYQGFARGFREDADIIHLAMQMFPHVLVAYSLSKAMGLYNDRVGALIVQSSSQEQALATDSHLRALTRMLISNPPAHGLRIAEIIFTDEHLQQMWLAELEQQRARLQTLRAQLVAGLAPYRESFSYIAHQFGLFSLTGLSVAEVHRLKEEFGIYFLDNGRINIAGLTQHNLPIVIEAVKRVIVHDTEISRTL